MVKRKRHNNSKVKVNGKIIVCSHLNIFRMSKNTIEDVIDTSIKFKNHIDKFKYCLNYFLEKSMSKNDK